MLSKADESGDTAVMLANINSRYIHPEILFKEYVIELFLSTAIMVTMADNNSTSICSHVSRHNKIRKGEKTSIG